MTDQPQQPLSGNDSDCAAQRSREIQGTSDHIGESNEMVPSQHPVESAADRLVSVDCSQRQANYSVIGQASDTAGSGPSKESVEAAKQTPWEFACGWYRESEIEHHLNRQKSHLIDEADRVPEDIYSKEFVRWLTSQYRLAMRKGIEIGRDDAATVDLRKQFTEYVQQTLQDRMERDLLLEKFKEATQHIKDSTELLEQGKQAHERLKKQRDEALAMVNGLSFVCGECRWCGGMFGNCAADCRLGKLLKEVSNG